MQFREEQAKQALMSDREQGVEINITDSFRLD